ncbi:hypothetical protein B0T14DRAFT_566674 [Immersiella caudata]|uniref:Uncharacterized protein n=1 Tax=Immersiella caudata TaxID=314043 RepID=A0AA39WQS3_9PEZI|nr:hypothetical protein B0T14DRAFT_566674 [Immersiella caudata]
MGPGADLDVSATWPWSITPAWDKSDHGYPRRGPGWDFIIGVLWSTAKADKAFCLWFIDYRIKRNQRYQEPTEEQAKGLGEKSPRVFYASDRRFTEVEEKQLGKRAGHERMWDAGYEIPEDDDDCFCCGALGFVELLSHELDNHWDYDENWWLDCVDFSWIKYGILACEYL